MQLSAKDRKRLPEWGEILTLRADYLSETQPMDRYWRIAQSTATRNREYKKTP